jgi:hypothetical protein
MESGATSTGSYLMHLCRWWQLNRFFGQTHHAAFRDRSSLALYSDIYYTYYTHLAADGIGDQYPFWSISLLCYLFKENGATNGIGKKSRRRVTANYCLVS